jgi:hypothetical protein
MALALVTVTGRLTYCRPALQRSQAACSPGLHQGLP